jgi:voltage-dependent potassium channel beta subunit
VEYRFLGRSGLRVSALSFGSWVTFGDQMDEDLAHACMKAAREAGVNFFDNAEVYAGGRSETIMGQVLQRAGWKRTDLVISTKIYWGGEGPNDHGLSRKHILEGTDAALDRLQLKYVDLVFCHRPDLYTPVEETVRAMSHLVETGRAFYWGTSEWSAEMIRQAFEIARRGRLVPPTMEQPQYNMLHRDRVEREYARLYADMGLGLTTWSPLASGLLTGKYDHGVPEGSRLTLEGYEWLRDIVLGEGSEEKLAKVRGLASVAEDLLCTRAQLAIAWCLQNPRVSTVITGASRPEQVVENMQAPEVVKRLTPAVRDRIEAILDNRPKPEQDWRRLAERDE